MSILRYSIFWFKVEYYQLFAEIIPTGGLVYISHNFYVFIIVLSIIASISLVFTLKKILQANRLFLPVLFIALVYLATLWLRNYSDYLKLGQPLAIQGRYLVPVLIYIYALAGMGIYYVTKRLAIRSFLQPAIVLIVTVTFLYFGGYIRYLSAISPNDYWQPQPISKNHSNKSVSVSDVHSSLKPQKT